MTKGRPPQSGSQKDLHLCRLDTLQSADSSIHSRVRVEREEEKEKLRRERERENAV